MLIMKHSREEEYSFTQTCLVCTRVNISRLLFMCLVEEELKLKGKNN